MELAFLIVLYVLFFGPCWFFCFFTVYNKCRSGECDCCCWCCRSKAETDEEVERGATTSGNSSCKLTLCWCWAVISVVSVVGIVDNGQSILRWYIARNDTWALVVPVPSLSAQLKRFTLCDRKSLNQKNGVFSDIPDSRAQCVLILLYLVFDSTATEKATEWWTSVFEWVGQVLISRIK